MNQIEMTIFNLLRQAQAIHLNVIKVTIESFGDNSLITASACLNLGVLYTHQKKYTVIFQLFLSFEH